MYLLYISNIRHSKLRGLQKCILSKDKRLHRLWWSSYAMEDYKQAIKIQIPALFVIVRKVMEDMFVNVFWIFWTSWHLEVAKCKIRNLKLSMKTFSRKWEGEALPKFFFTDKKLDKCQNECYPDNLKFLLTYHRACDLSHFSTKKESVIILKIKSLWRINVAIFYNAKNRYLFSLQHICFLYFLLRKSFFKDI